MDIIDYICHYNKYKRYNSCNNIYTCARLLLYMFSHVTKMHYQGLSISLTHDKKTFVYKFFIYNY